MAGTAISYSAACREHDTGKMHPEKVERLDWIRAELEESGVHTEVTWLDPEKAERRWIETVHDPEYVAFVERACAEGRAAADFGETLLSPGSFRVARIAAGSALRAVDAVLRDGFRNAFSLARPPGHHARPGEAMGFCLFNHVAVAARYAQMTYGLERVAIVDWDVHHGNGTQEIFYDDPTVLFVSLHQSPLYPGSGAAEETGVGRGRGSTLNCPMAAGACWEDYEEAWIERVRPALHRFQPQLILVSAGFDAHAQDPLAGIELRAVDFATFTSALCDYADEVCDGRVVSVLEGGYDRTGLATSAREHVRALVAASSGR